jgi:hypothetical protein
MNKGETMGTESGTAAAAAEGGARPLGRREAKRLAFALAAMETMTPEWVADDRRGARLDVLLQACFVLTVFLPLGACALGAGGWAAAGMFGALAVASTCLAVGLHRRNERLRAAAEDAILGSGAPLDGLLALLDCEAVGFGGNVLVVKRSRQRGIRHRARTLTASEEALDAIGGWCVLPEETLSAVGRCPRAAATLDAAFTAALRAAAMGGAAPVPDLAYSPGFLTDDEELSAVGFGLVTRTSAYPPPRSIHPEDRWAWSPGRMARGGGAGGVPLTGARVESRGCVVSRGWTWHRWIEIGVDGLGVLRSEDLIGHYDFAAILRRLEAEAGVARGEGRGR